MGSRGRAPPSRVGIRSAALNVTLSSLAAGGSVRQAHRSGASQAQALELGGSIAPEPPRDRCQSLQSNTY